MDVSKDSAFTVEHEGEIYYFCSSGCRDIFIRKQQDENADKRHFDLIIIGAGPAGLTAAVYASLLKINTFLIAGDIGGQAIDSTKIENYMGYDLITGPDLVSKFQQQLLENHYVSHAVTKAESITQADDGFRIVTSDNRRYTAPCVLITTGMSRRKLSVPGEEQFQRKGIFYGNIQDYGFVQQKNAVVIGGGNSAVQVAEILHTVARQVVVISDFDLSADAEQVARIRAFENCEIRENCSVEAFEGNATLSSVVFREKGISERERIPADGAFISIGLRANSGLVRHLAECNEKKEIITQKDCSTSCDGLFAAGDVTDTFGKRIVIASGDGAKAALAVKKYLMRKRKAA